MVTQIANTYQVVKKTTIGYSISIGLTKKFTRTIGKVYTIVYTFYKRGDFMQATTQKLENSQGIRIPKAFLEAVGMAENNSVEPERMNDSTIIKKVEHSSKVTLEEIFAGYEGDYKTENFDWGKPVGKEKW